MASKQEYSKNSLSSNVGDSYSGSSGGTSSGSSDRPGLARGILGFLRGAAQGVRETVFGLLPFLARAPKAGLVVVALLMFSIAAWHEFRTVPLPWSAEEHFLTHGLTPRELNSERALPAFDHAVINSVETVPGGKRVWIAGDAGLLAYSDDQGARWTTFHYDPANGTMVKDATVQQTLLMTPRLTWRVEAAQPQSTRLPPVQQKAPNPNPAIQQLPVGELQGTVTDEKGVPLAEARVLLNQGATPGQVSTGVDGSFAFYNLRPGEYLLNVSRQGFTPYEGKVLVRVGGTTPIRVVLTANVRSGNQATGPQKPSLRPQGANSAPRSGGATDAASQRKQTPPPEAPPDWSKVDFFSDSVGSLQSADAYLLITRDRGESWTRDTVPSGSRPHLSHVSPYLWTEVADQIKVHGIAGKEPNGALITGESPSGEAVIYGTADRGGTWKKQFANKGFTLRDIVFFDSSDTGFAVGTGGAILRTRDGGNHWEPITLGAAAPGKLSTDFRKWQQPTRIPAPLSLLIILAGFFVLLPVLFPETVPRIVEQSIASLTVSDAPVISTADDVLGFRPVARAISGLLMNKATKLPITLAVTAKWGRGKTSLMSMVQQELKAAGWRTVWFNAWHHQEELSLLASLLQTIRQKAPPQLLERGGVLYRIRLLGGRLMRWRTLWVAATCFVLYNAESAFHENHPHFYGCTAQYLYTSSGGTLSSEENICPDAEKNAASTASPVNTSVQNEGAKLKQAKGTPVAAPAVKEKAGKAQEQKPGKVPGEEGKAGGEKPGILQFVMRLLFDAVGKAEKYETSGIPGLHLIPLLVLGVLVAALGWQILESFGANPAELLTPQTAHNTVSELEARTIFLEKFRKEYGDVVGALGKFRLVILVDDLDRCRPEKISEMLEAANYLVAAGPCAVVMALEETAVLAGLGLSFQRMAEEMVELKDGDSAKGDFLAECRKKRLEFAKNYVEKLINVIVHVPSVDSAQFGRAMAGETRRRATRKEARELRLREFASLVRVPAAAIIIAGIILVCGSLLDNALKGSKAETETERSGLAAPTNPLSLQVQNAPQTVGGAVTALEAAHSLPPSYRSAAVPIPQRWFLGWQLQVAWTVLLVAFIATLLARRTSPATEDSPKFKSALSLWMPLLTEVNPSLRFGKRVLNRLRYLAMLSREAEREQSDEKEGPANKNSQNIPETLLVALGVLQLTRPAAFETEAAFANYLGDLNSPRQGSGAPGIGDKMTWQMHSQLFGSFTSEQILRYRRAYLQLSEGIVAR